MDSPYALATAPPAQQDLLVSADGRRIYDSEEQLWVGESEAHAAPFPCCTHVSFAGFGASWCYDAIFIC